MRKMNGLILAFVLLSAGPALAANGPFGVGLILGEPTGLSSKLWLDAERKTAVDMAAAWSLSGDNDFHFHGDYLFHQYSWLHDALNIQHGKLPVYFGLGGRVRVRENRDDDVGIRIPIGVSYIFDQMPVDVFAEIVPVVDIAPDTDGDLAGGVGVRFYF